MLEKIEGDPKSDYINASYIPVSFIPLCNPAQLFDDVMTLSMAVLVNSSQVDINLKAGGLKKLFCEIVLPSMGS